jgi:hypothetical protein
MLQQVRGVLASDLRGKPVHPFHAEVLVYQQ